MQERPAFSLQRLFTQIMSAHVQVPLLWPLSSNSPRQNGEEIKFMSQTLRFFSLKKPSATGHPGEHCFIIHYELYRNSHILPCLCVCVCVSRVCPAVSGWIIHCGVMMKQLDCRPCECFSAQSASPYTLSQPKYCHIHLFSRKEPAAI